MARTSKHGSCIGHVKLPCGCKCCDTPQSTVHYDREAIESFHAYIHTMQALHASRPRLTGDGLMQTDDGRVPPPPTGDPYHPMRIYQPTPLRVTA